MTSSPIFASSWVWVPNWEPDNMLRTMRHHLNNLLAPVSIAAEILDTSTPESAMLVQAASRLHRTSTRVGLVLNPGSPKCVNIIVPDFAKILLASSSPSKFSTPQVVDASSPPGGLDVCGVVSVDMLRFVARIFKELSPDASVLSMRIENLCFPNGDTHQTFILQSKSSTPPLTSTEINLLPYPLALPSGGVGMAILCRECALQGFAVRVCMSASILEVCIPLATV